MTDDEPGDGGDVHPGAGSTSGADGSAPGATDPDEDDARDGPRGRNGERGGATAGPAADDPERRTAVDALAARPAANVGMLVAAVALLGAFLPWTDAPGLVPAVAGAGSTVAAVLAAVATAAFAGRRHGVLPRRAGAAAAGAGAAGVLLTAVGRFVAPAVGAGGAPAVGSGLPLAAVASTVAVGLAVADARGLSGARLVEMVRRSAVGLGLVVGAFALQYLVVIVLVSLDALAGAPLEGVSVGPVGMIVVQVVLADVVFAAVAVGFLLSTDRGYGYIDLVRPDLEDAIYVVVGIVGLFVVLIGLQLAVFAADLPSTSNNIVESARQGHPETLLVLIPLSFLLIAPAEELLNRNVIQKYLYGPFSRSAAIVVASGIFASAHVFSYAGDSAVGMVVSLLNVFVLSLLLGVLYERTDNIVVPTIVHGVFNAVQFALLYVAIVYQEELQQAAVALPW